MVTWTKTKSTMPSSNTTLRMVTLAQTSRSTSTSHLLAGATSSVSWVDSRTTHMRTRNGHSIMNRRKSINCKTAHSGWSNPTSRFPLMASTVPRQPHLPTYLLDERHSSRCTSPTILSPTKDSPSPTTWWSWNSPMRMVCKFRWMVEPSAMVVPFSYH